MKASGGKGTAMGKETCDMAPGTSLQGSGSLAEGMGKGL